MNIKQWTFQRNLFMNKLCKWTLTILISYDQASILALTSFLEIEWSRTAFAIPAISPRRNGKTLHFHNSITDIAANSNICYWEEQPPSSDLGNIENMQDCPKPKVLRLLPFSQSKLQLSTNGKGIYVQHLLKPTFEVPSGAFYVMTLHNWSTVSPDSF